MAIPIQQRIGKAFDMDWAPDGMDPAEFTEQDRVKYASAISGPAGVWVGEGAWLAAALV